MKDKNHMTLDKENDLARAKRNYFRKRKQESIENYRKMIGLKSERNRKERKDGLD